MTKTSTAYHEAGHAVIGRKLGLICGSATIVRNEAEGEEGHAITGGPWFVLGEWENEGKFHRGAESVFRARIISTMAGAEAEKELLGTEAIGDGEDRKQIAWMLPEANELRLRRMEANELRLRRMEARLRRMAVMLVRRHRASVEAVAKALLKSARFRPQR